MSMVNRDYVIYATAPWSAPWLTEHNLANALSKHRRVLFVEPPMTPATPFRYGVQREAINSLKSLVTRRSRRIGSISVFRPVVLPPLSNPRARLASARLFRAQIRHAVAAAGLTTPSVIAAAGFPKLSGAAGETLFAYLVKDWISAGSNLLGRDGSALEADQQALCRKADIVISTSHGLGENLATKGIDSVVIRHGFATDLIPQFEAGPPASYSSLPRPLLGYTGRIDARLDFDLICGLAEHFSSGSIILVGPVSPRLPASVLEPLLRKSNVHLLSATSRSKLPAYVRHLDCCLLPYKRDEWNGPASPLKLWDYLYGGPPIVGCGMDALFQEPQHLVRAAEPLTPFIESVEAALAEGNSGSAVRRRHALANSWDSRAEQFELALDAITQ